MPDKKPTEQIIEKIEWFDDRYYKVLTPPDFTTEDFYPSATTVLGIINKPWLLQWYGDLGTELARHRSNYAKARGSLIHDAIHSMLLLNQKLTYTSFHQEAWLQLYNFKQFYDSVKPEVIGSEMEVVSHTHQYAGTLDMLFEIKKGKYDLGYSKPVEVAPGLYIGDIKTGNESSDYNYQVAAYAQAVKEMGLGEPVGTFILYTDANTKRGWKAMFSPMSEVANHFNMFTHALALWKNTNAHTKPRLFEMPATIQLQE